ncbi:hypothetical protein N431DRAFT_403387 [Stipitochalara longipes BDJ]|nr:hypothetical protein N431DRAFT_403387 [Stipitochalara longipes BDJ]
MSFISAPSNSCQLSPQRGYARRSDWTTYILVVWLDYVCLSVVAALTLGLYCTPMYYKDRHVVPMLPSITLFSTSRRFESYQLPMGISYPWVKEPLPTYGCALAVVIVPLLVMGLFQIRTWSVWDFHTGVMGLLKAVVSTSFICTVLKHSIGGFRPYYIEACKPDWDAIVGSLNQKGHLFDATLCLGNPHAVDRALQAFPSGHASSSFAAAIFLTLYLNAKLKVFCDHSSPFWAFLVMLTPLILASLVSGSMYTSHQHQAHDLVFGMIIGLVIGILAYRSAYAAVFDFRSNHIPLLPYAIKNQHSPYAHCHYDTHAKMERDQVTESDDVSFKGWPKKSEVRYEEREEGMVWLESNKSIRWAGLELEPEINSKMRDTTKRQ